MSTTMTTANSQEQLLARIAELEAKIALKPINDGSMFKITPTGRVSVYGLSSRFPVTLTCVQWLIVIKRASELKSFMKANWSKLSFKDAAQQAKAIVELG